MWAGDQGAKLIQVESLIRSGGGDLALAFPGAAIDPGGDFSPLPALYTVPGSGGAVSVYSYPFAFLCAPLFDAFGHHGLILPSLAAAIGLLALFLPLARAAGIRSPRWFAAALAAATPVLFYAFTFWEHQLAACVASGALLLAARALGDGRAAWAAAAGTIAALGFLIRPEALFLGPALGLGLAAARAGAPRDRLALAGAAVLGWMIGLIPGVWLHQTLYGHPLGGAAALNFGRPALDSMPLLAEKLSPGRARLALSLALDREPDLRLFALLIVLALAIRFTAGRWRAVPCLALAAASFWLWLPESGPYLKTGLLASCPLLLLALTPPDEPSPGRPTRSLLYWFCALYFLAVALTAPNDGGAQWGPRYLLPLIPPAAALAWHRAERLLRHPERPERVVTAQLVAVLLGISAILQVHSLSVLESSLTRSATLRDATAEVGHRIVLTDIWWAPQILARLYFERQIFLLHEPRQLEDFVALLDAHDLERFVLVASRDEHRDLDRLRAAGADCRSTVDSDRPLLVLDCRAAGLIEPVSSGTL